MPRLILYYIDSGDTYDHQCFVLDDESKALIKIKELFGNPDATTEDIWDAQINGDTWKEFYLYKLPDDALSGEELFEINWGE